jgi:hypothetical protein
LYFIACGNKHSEVSTKGMSENDILKLEKAINKKLPKFYKDFLLQYPDDLINLGAPYNTVSELHLPNTVDRLLEISDLVNPPQNVLIIGVDGLGNCYYILLENNDTEIYLFDHEAPAFLDEKQEVIDWEKSWSLVYNNLKEFIADLKDKLKD